MKKIVFIISFLGLTYTLAAQTVIGKLIDQNGNGLPGYNLELHIYPEIYTTNSSSDGSFTFNNITSVEVNELPKGYSISNNYPNPFNPKTRFIINLVKSSHIKISVFNLLGQKVTNDIEKYLEAGEKTIDLELNGLSNGIYFAKISIDDKYNVVRKLILLYGSKHLQPNDVGSSLRINKNSLANNEALDTVIDSLVVTGPNIYRHVFTSFPTMTDTLLNLGNVTINLLPEVPKLKSPPDSSINVELQPMLYWYSSTNAIEYKLQLSNATDFSDIVYEQNGIDSTNHQVIELNSLSTYYWRVAANNNSGNSEYSEIWSFTTDTIFVVNVALNKDSLSLFIGDTEQLIATVQPSNASNKSIEWSSSNDSVAIVSENGVVTAIAEGSSKIIAQTVEGDKRDSCIVTVSPISVSGVTLNKNHLSLVVGDDEQLNATIYPTNATNKEVEWLSSNDSVAIVSPQGLVSALSQGSTTIIVKTIDGDKTDSCTVDVSNYYEEIGVEYLAPDGLTVMVDSINVIEKTGSFQYKIYYKLKNNTPDKAIDEGTFALFKRRTSNHLPQYGFFGTLYPGDTKIKSYTFEEVKSITFDVLEYGADFFATSPSPNNLKWEVIYP